MQQTQDKKAIHQNILDRYSLQQNSFEDNPGLLQLRENAIRSFNETGLPTSKNEIYKYSQITKILDREFTFKEENTLSDLSPDDLNKYLIPDLEGDVLVFINGVFSKENSKRTSSKDQLIIQQYNEMTPEVTAEIAALGKLDAGLQQDPFLSINSAMADAGVVIKVPDGKVVEKPVVLYFITDTRHGKIIQEVKNILIVGKHSQVEVIEYHGGEGDVASFSNTSTEIFVQSAAVASLYKIENENEKSIHVDNTAVYQHKDSVFTSATISLSGGFIRNNLMISLEDQHCEANMYGLYLTQEKQHVDNQTTVDHKKPNCVSNELYKGILDGFSTGVFNGKIYVRPNAQKTNAFQSNKNVLLSDDATINTKPQLEIWADDVKCSHGATTGQLDPEQLFYLRARGLDQETARAMLLYAFAIDVLEPIKIPALKTFLDKIISSRLQKTG